MSKSSFPDAATKIRGAFDIAAEREYHRVFACVSGGTESLAAADAALRFGDEYGIEVDGILHINTGAGCETTHQTVQEFCRDRDVPYIEVLNQKEGEMLAHRVLENGFPSSSSGQAGSKGGHHMEYANRKERLFERAYGRGFREPRSDDEILYISGARILESDKRAETVPTDAVAFGETGEKHPMLTWCSPIAGLTDAEIESYIDEHDIPETEAYDFVGHSGDCLGCSFDTPGIIRELSILEPYLAHALVTLSVWVYQRRKRGEIDIPLKACVWGWDNNETETSADGKQCRMKEWVGCDEDGCGYKARESPEPHPSGK